MKKFLNRIQPILNVGVSALVLLICVVGIAGIWVVESALSSSAVQMLQAVDHVAQRMRIGVGGVDNNLVSLGESVSSVKAASEQISQNVSDMGLLYTLLPTTKEQELTIAVQSVRDNFVAIHDFLNATNQMVQAINGLPFIDLPSDSLASIDTFQDRITKMAAMVENLQASVSDFRFQVAENISIITESVTNLTNLLTEMHSDLAEVDAELETIQVKSEQLQRQLPMLLILSTSAVTLVSIWIGYSQIVMINKALGHLRDLGSSQATIKSVELEISTPQETQSTANEETGVSDTDQYGRQ